MVQNDRDHALDRVRRSQGWRVIGQSADQRRRNFGGVRGSPACGRTAQDWANRSPSTINSLTSTPGRPLPKSQPGSFRSGRSTSATPRTSTCSVSPEPFASRPVSGPTAYRRVDGRASRAELFARARGRRTDFTDHASDPCRAGVVPPVTPVLTRSSLACQGRPPGTQPLKDVSCDLAGREARPLRHRHPGCGRQGQPQLPFGTSTLVV